MAGQYYPLRAIAAQVLQSVSDGQSLSQALPAGLAQIEERERPQLQALCYGTCRWYHRLESELQSRLRKPLKRGDQIVTPLMLVALFQLRYSDRADYAILNETVEACRALGKPHLAGLVNAVLRGALREGEPASTDPAVAHSHPGWLVEKLRHNWPDKWEAILAANNTQAPMTLRVNARATSRDAYLQALHEAGLAAVPSDHARFGIQLEQPCPVELLPDFADGHVSVQDEATQLCTQLLDLQPGQRVLDACAAPGGKTCAILETERELSEVIALDSSDKRLTRVEENLQRLNLDARLQAADAGELADWWDETPFDRILLDVPCSASGVIRRHPDIKLLRREGDVAALAAIQLRLLKTLWRTLKPGGKLVYATCSVFPQENSRIIQRFLAQQNDARLTMPALDWGLDTGSGYQLFPQEQGHDGFFYACLTRSDSLNAHQGPSP